MTPAQKDQHAKYAAMGMQLMKRDDKTQEEKLEFFKTMDDKYPGIGWGIEGMKLKKMWDKRAARETPCPW